MNKAPIVIDIQNDITKHYREIIDEINKAIDWACKKFPLKGNWFLSMGFCLVFYIIMICYFIFDTANYIDIEFCAIKPM